MDCSSSWLICSDLTLGLRRGFRAHTPNTAVVPPRPPGIHGDDLSPSPNIWCALCLQWVNSWAPFTETRTHFSPWCLGSNCRLMTHFWNTHISRKPRGIPKHPQQAPLLLHVPACFRRVFRNWLIRLKLTTGWKLMFCSELWGLPFYSTSGNKSLWTNLLGLQNNKKLISYRHRQVYNLYHPMQGFFGIKPNAYSTGLMCTSDSVDCPNHTWSHV